MKENTEFSFLYNDWCLILMIDLLYFCKESYYCLLRIWLRYCWLAAALTWTSTQCTLYAYLNPNNNTYTNGCIVVALNILACVPSRINKRTLFMHEFPDWDPPSLNPHREQCELYIGDFIISLRLNQYYGIVFWR